MAERLTSALLGIVPLFIIIPAFQQLAQKMQSGQFQLTDLFNILLPVVLVSALVEVFK